MDLNRLLKLSGVSRLDEDFTQDSGSNEEILSYCDRLQGDNGQMAYDALEVLHDAGADGLIGAEWLRKLAGLWPDAPGMKEVVKQAASHFVQAGLIDKQGNRFVWNRDVAFAPAPKAGTEPDFDQGTQEYQQAHQHVSLTYDAVAIIRNRGEISEAEWADALGRKFGMPAQMAKAFIQHILKSFRGVIVSAGPGRWRYVENATENPMDTLANIAGGRARPESGSMSFLRDLVNNPTKHQINDDE